MSKDTGFRALANHLQDLWRLGNFSFHNPHSLTKFRQIKSVARRAGAQCLIESGTYWGHTTKRCAPLFQKIVTIEIDKSLAEQATRFLKNNANVEVLQGDVIDSLPGILDRQDFKNVLVYLDGHFSGGITGRGATDEPACDAIEILSKYRDKLSAIIVDDFREFGRPGAPKKSDLIEACESFFGDTTTLGVHLDQVIVFREPDIDSRPNSV